MRLPNKIAKIFLSENFFYSKIKHYLCTVKERILEELKKSEVYIVITEDSVALNGSLPLLAALLATAVDKEPLFYKAFNIAVQAYNDYQIQKN